MKTLLRSFPLICAAVLCANTVQATTITVVYTDGPGEGFNDTDSRTAVTGNSGTTLGQQRKNVFEAVADYWESRLDSEIEITVSASFDPLDCNPTDATLGSAGPNSTHMNFPDAPLMDVIYPAALANSLANADLAPADSDITAEFNSTLDLGNETCVGGDTWDYRLDGEIPSGFGLYDTVVHELAHGLGFLTFVDDTTGERQMGLDDHYMRFLFDESTMMNWSDMTDAQRLTSVTNTGNVVFTGPKAVAESAFLSSGQNNAKPRIYTPSPVESGSSVSHWDTALLPDEMMEPSATDKVEDWLTIKAFLDMGWKGNACTKTPLPSNQWIMFSLDCTPPAGENKVADIIGDDVTGAFLDTWAVFAFNETTGVYDRATPTTEMEVGKGYWVQHINPGMVIIDLPIDSSRTPSVVPEADGCRENDSCFSQPLVTPGVKTNQWNMIGNPFRQDIALDNLRVVTDSGTCVDGCTLPDAQTNDIMRSAAFTYTSTSTAYATLDSGDAIPAGASMWVNVMPSANGLNPQLLFPR